jgi:hypothetical protein
VIPAEAVRAAFIALYERDHIGGVGSADIRAALEAAAPYIRAQALEDAADAWDMRSGEFEDTTPGYLKYLATKERATHGNH